MIRCGALLIKYHSGAETSIGGSSLITLFCAVKMVRVHRLPMAMPLGSLN